MKNILTENEIKIMMVVKDTMDTYGDGFSDVMVEDLVSETGMNVRSVKGILGSLAKKNLVNFNDVNGEYNVYSLTKAGFDALGEKPDYYEDIF